jgi:hypothetical protein
MAANPSQFGINDHHKDIMKNMVIPGISVDVMISVTLQAASEINIGHLIINSSPEQSRSEVMTRLLREIRAEIGKETYEMMQICVIAMQLWPVIL